MAILFISGVNDLSQIGVTLDDNGRMGYLMDGNCSVQHRLSLGDRAVASLLIFGKGVKQHSVEFKQPPSLIFNQIADPDTHRGALQRCIELCERVDTAVINHPRQVLQTARDQVSQTLQGIPGVRMPQTLRFQPHSPEDVISQAAAAGYGFPFIARVAGLHGGVSMVRVEKADDHGALHALPFDGRDFYLTEFVDYRSPDGLYRKTRIVVVDGVPLIRHHLIDDRWMVHASSAAFMEQRPPLVDEARTALADFGSTLRPRVQPAITEIAQRLGLDYFGIDCHIDGQGEMLIFEANANMNIFYNRRDMYVECLDTIKNHLLRMVDQRSGQPARVLG